MTKSPTYTLEVGEKGRIRLEILNELCNPSSMDLIHKSGLQKGSSVLEVGCGIGLLTSEIANYVGKTGKVIGTDISHEQIAIAKENGRKYACAPCDFLELPGDRLSELQEQFDAVYCRFILSHTKNTLDIIEEMSSRLKKGGLFIAEEAASQGGFFSIPRSDVYDAWEKLINKQLLIYGLDNTTGAKLPEILRKMGYQIKITNLFQPVLKTKREKELMRLDLIERRPAYLKSKRATEEEVDHVIHALKDFEDDPSFFVAFYRYTQIAAVKG